MFYWEIHHSKKSYETASGTWVAYFPYLTSEDIDDVISRFFTAVYVWVIVGLYNNKKKITGYLEDMNFMFSWQEQYLTRSLRQIVRYCLYSNIKFISSASRQHVISSVYITDKLRYRKLQMILCIYNLTWCMHLKTGITTFRSIEITADIVIWNWKMLKAERKFQNCKHHFISRPLSHFDSHRPLIEIPFYMYMTLHPIYVLLYGPL